MVSVKRESSAGIAVRSGQVEHMDISVLELVIQACAGSLSFVVPNGVNSPHCPRLLAVSVGSFVHQLLQEIMQLGFNSSRQHIQSRSTVSLGLSLGITELTGSSASVEMANNIRQNFLYLAPLGSSTDFAASIRWTLYLS